MNDRPHYLPWPVQAALIKERMAQPIVIDGKRYIRTFEAAQRIGHKPDYLRHLAAEHDGDGPHVTRLGYVFVRRPRCSTDMRAPLFWLEESL